MMPAMTMLDAIYEAVAAQTNPQADRQAAMQDVVVRLWAALRDRDVSWLGFYVDQPDQPDDRRLVLGPHRDKPACSPIGLHGVCGQVLVSGRSRIVDDVHALGTKYVACDPRDRSELVLPLFEEDGQCWGVLDLDSFSAGRFTASDRDGCRGVLQAAGFRTD